MKFNREKYKNNSVSNKQFSTFGKRSFLLMGEKGLKIERKLEKAGNFRASLTPVRIN